MSTNDFTKTHFVKMSVIEEEVKKLQSKPIENEDKKPDHSSDQTQMISMDTIDQYILEEDRHKIDELRATLISMPSEVENTLFDTPEELIQFIAQHSGFFRRNPEIRDKIINTLHDDAETLANYLLSNIEDIEAREGGFTVLISLWEKLEYNPSENTTQRKKGGKSSLPATGNYEDSNTNHMFNGVYQEDFSKKKITPTIILIISVSILIILVSIYLQK